MNILNRQRGHNPKETPPRTEQQTPLLTEVEQESCYHNVLVNMLMYERHGVNDGQKLMIGNFLAHVVNFGNLIAETF